MRQWRPLSETCKYSTGFCVPAGTQISQLLSLKVTMLLAFRAVRSAVGLVRCRASRGHRLTLAAGASQRGICVWLGRLRPLRAITEAARSASQESLDQRLALAGPADELTELAETFDEMLARLDDAFASQRRFVANASHELRTPLTEMRTLIDVTLAKPAASAAQLGSVLTAIRATVDKSEELIERCCRWPAPTAGWVTPRWSTCARRSRTPSTRSAQPRQPCRSGSTPRCSRRRSPGTGCCWSGWSATS